MKINIILTLILISGVLFAGSVKDTFKEGQEPDREELIRYTLSDVVAKESVKSTVYKLELFRHDIFVAGLTARKQKDDSFKYRYVTEDKKTGARITQTYSLSVLFTYLEYKWDGTIKNVRVK